MAKTQSKRAKGRSASSGGRVSPLWQRALSRLMPRHAPFYFGLLIGAVVLALSLWLLPKFAVSLGSNALFLGYMTLTFIKLPHLSAEYLRENAKSEDTPVGGIFLIVLIVVVASVVSLFLALNSGGTPDPWEVAASVLSVILGWFTIQTMGALHYAYEYYQVPDSSDGAEIEGGLGFQGEDDPDGFDFMYFSFTVGTSVATSDTKVESREMRRLLTVHLVFSHLFNTIILAAAVNVLISLGGGG